jgi:hypothetical protein
MTLHLIETYEVTCDFPKCYAYTQPMYSEGLANDDARNRGWVQQSANQWLCPDHGTYP